MGDIFLEVILETMNSFVEEVCNLRVALILYIIYLIRRKDKSNDKEN